MVIRRGPGSSRERMIGWRGIPRGGCEVIRMGRAIRDIGEGASRGAIGIPEARAAERRMNPLFVFSFRVFIFRFEVHRFWESGSRGGEKRSTATLILRLAFITGRPTKLLFLTSAISGTTAANDQRDGGHDCLDTAGAARPAGPPYCMLLYFYDH